MNTYSTQQFLQLENEIWSALVKGDANASSQLLTDDFLGVYSSGFAGKLDHINQLKDGPTVSHYEIFEARIQVITDDAVLLSYLASYEPCKNEKVTTSESMYVTSVWRRINGVWKNSFSQDTPIEEQGKFVLPPQDISQLNLAKMLDKHTKFSYKGGSVIP